MPLIAALLFAGFPAIGSLSLQAPLLEIRTVLPPAPGQPFCTFDLQNKHGEPAVAWAVEDYSGAIKFIDVLLTPELWIQPGASQPTTLVCDESLASGMSMLFVQYADGNIAGQSGLLSRITQVRREWLNGLRSLIQLLAAAQLPSSTVSPESRLLELVSNSSGPAISDLVRGSAKNALGRTSRAQGAASVDRLRSALLGALNHDVQTLDRFTRTQ